MALRDNLSTAGSPFDSAVPFRLVSGPNASFDAAGQVRQSRRGECSQRRTSRWMKTRRVGPPTLSPHPDRPPAIFKDTWTTTGPAHRAQLPSSCRWRPEGPVGGAPNPPPAIPPTRIRALRSTACDAAALGRRPEPAALRDIARLRRERRLHFSRKRQGQSRGGPAVRRDPQRCERRFVLPGDLRTPIPGSDRCAGAWSPAPHMGPL